MLNLIPAPTSLEAWGVRVLLTLPPHVDRHIDHDLALLQTLASPAGVQISPRKQPLLQPGALVLEIGAASNVTIS